MKLPDLKSLLGTTAGKTIAVASLGLAGVVGAVFVNNIRSDKDKYVFNFSNLNPTEQKQLETKQLSEHLTVGDFLRHNGQAGDVSELGGNEDIIIKKPVVDMLENLITRMKAVNPDSALVITSGYRASPRDKKVGGSGTGPHTRGDAVDITFNVPNKTSLDSARLVAAEAHTLGVKGIAIDTNGESYAVHLDPIRKDEFFAEQQWKQVQENGKTKSVPWYKNVPPETWDSPKEELEGAWMAETDGQPLFVIRFERKDDNSYRMHFSAETPKEDEYWSDLVKSGTAYTARYVPPHGTFAPRRGEERTWGYSGVVVMTLEFVGGQLQGNVKQVESYDNRPTYSSTPLYDKLVSTGVPLVLRRDESAAGSGSSEPELKYKQDGFYLGDVRLGAPDKWNGFFITGSQESAAKEDNYMMINGQRVGEYPSEWNKYMNWLKNQPNGFYIDGELFEEPSYWEGAPGYDVTGFYLHPNPSQYKYTGHTGPNW